MVHLYGDIPWNVLILHKGKRLEVCNLLSVENIRCTISREDCWGDERALFLPLNSSICMCQPKREAWLLYHIICLCRLPSDVAYCIQLWISTDTAIISHHYLSITKFFASAFWCTYWYYLYYFKTQRQLALRKIFMQFQQSIKRTGLNFMDWVQTSPSLS